jgi:hypothetical protein
VTPNDRTLLEKAARAAGYNFQWEPGLLNEWPEPTVFTPEGFGQYWNALEDDGDALRLSADARMRVEQTETYAVAFSGSCMAEMFSERVNGNRYAATRRAIVRAAASLGEQHDR